MPNLAIETLVGVAAVAVLGAGRRVYYTLTSTTTVLSSVTATRERDLIC